MGLVAPAAEGALTPFHGGGVQRAPPSAGRKATGGAGAPRRQTGVPAKAAPGGEGRALSGAVGAASYTVAPSPPRLLSLDLGRGQPALGPL